HPRLSKLKKELMTDLKILMESCENELIARGYYPKTIAKWKNCWKDLKNWMQSNSISELNEEIAEKYCMQAFGMYYVKVDSPRKNKQGLRAIRLLVSFHLTGDLEAKCPHNPIVLTGPLGNVAKEYLKYCEDELGMRYATLAAKKADLRLICNYAIEKQIDCGALSGQHIESFFQESNFTDSRWCRCGHNMRSFLRFLHAKEYIEEDLSAAVPKSSYREDAKLPSVYSTNEINSILGAVDQTSAMGKRDYLILLLASQCGLRATDIGSLQIGEVDWDRDMICHVASKNGEKLEIPLVASVGNAIYEYLTVRPKSPSNAILVSLKAGRKGLPLTPKRIGTIVSNYIAKADIKDRGNRRHGSHALRHSLATELLEKGTPLPVIGSVLGHRSPESTAIYTKVSPSSLRKCALPMPPLKSTFYADVKTDEK
ncbi:MAG: tyrosine-type recombinase/integrase, partial [Burkholderiales bacterium]|nr:tyrosine-type recombinase/integrase [Burkholderiales bacterium]